MFKAVIRPSDIKSDGKCNIKLRIKHKGKHLYLSTTYYIFPEYFDIGRGQVKETHPNFRELNIQLKTLILDAERKILSLKDKANRVDISFIKNYLKQDDLHDIYKVFEKVIEDKKRMGSIRNAANYQFTLNKLKSFYPHSELSFETIDYKFLDEFNTFLNEQKLKVNTISILLRCLRAIFNRAINMDLVSYDIYPFRRFKIKTEQSRKRNLPASIIYKIANCDLKGQQQKARDLFMLSFYLMGMNIIDIYLLKKSDLLTDRIRYRRKKTGKNVSVKVLPEAKEIIERYKGKKYLLNLHEQYTDPYNLTKRVNTELKTIAGLIGIHELTFYYARHSWASIGASIGIPQDVIGKAL